MKKILNMFLASAVALSFASCDKNKTNNEPENEGTSTSVQFSVAEAGIRAINDGQQDVVGQTGESTVTGGRFLTPTASTDFALTETATNSGMYMSGKVMYTGTTGTQKTTLLVNAPVGVNANVNTPDQTVDITKLGVVAAKTGFTMSATIANNDIKESVKETDVAAGNNLFSYEVERVVSKVQVTVANDAAMPTVGGDLAGLGTFPKDQIYYAVAGGAKELYLFGDHKGVRTLDPTTKKYTDFKSHPCSSCINL